MKGSHLFFQPFILVVYISFHCCDLIRQKDEGCREGETKRYLYFSTEPMIRCGNLLHRSCYRAGGWQTLSVTRYWELLEFNSISGFQINLGWHPIWYSTSHTPGDTQIQTRFGFLTLKVWAIIFFNSSLCSHII